MRTMRLTCRWFWVDTRLARINGRWIASSDAPSGPTLGLGDTPLEALAAALEPFDGVRDELLETAPEELFEQYWEPKAG
jgi:hypothetical protein